MHACSRMLTLHHPSMRAAVATTTRTLSRSRVPAATAAFFHGSSAPTLQRVTTKTTFDLPDPSVTKGSNNRMPPLTKIVATVGPTSEQAEPLKLCVKAGMHSMRLNFSHATVAEVELRSANLQAAVVALTPSKAAAMMRTQDVISVLLDTKGPELRTGKLANDESGHDTVELVTGDIVTLHASPSTMPNNNAGSTATDLLIEFSVLADVLQPDRLVLLDDGAIVLQVVAANHNDPSSTQAQAGTVKAVVQNSGSLRSRAGVNLPLADTAQHLPALSDKDKRDITYGMTSAADIDFVAASFVQTAQHVIDIRKHLIATAAQLKDGQWKDKPLPLIISKIETASALKHFDEILAVSDGIMVARGDLGVEIPLQQVTNAQKEMVAACNAAGKPVIVATQMLESMTKAPRPTRAEVSDVTNAVYDGADCVMLSGETAKGKYPVATIKMMREIILSAERYAAKSQALGHPVSHKFVDSPKTAVSAIAKAAVTAAFERDDCASILVVLRPPISATAVQDPSCPAPYSLPGLIAAHRPNVPIFTFCHTPKQARQLQIYRGIHPVLLPQSASAAHAAGSADVSTVMNEAKQMGYVSTGDEVVLVVEEGDAASIKIMTVA